MMTIEAITTAISQLPPDQVAQVRLWLEERAELDWDQLIEEDEKMGRLEGVADRAMSEHKAGRTHPL